MEFFDNGWRRRIKARLRQALGPWAKHVQYYSQYPRQLVMPDIDVLTTTERGLLMACSHENYIEREIMTTGRFEADSTAVVEREVTPGQLVFDVGSNIGYYTMLLADLVGPTGAVHAFEPTAWAYQRSLRNLLMNPRLLDVPVAAHQLGLLARAQEFVSAIESRFSAKVLAHSQPERMRFTTIDAYCADRDITHIDFMKIDVDGHDVGVLRGAERTFAAHRPTLLCELCDRVLAPNGDSVATYVAWLADHGYHEGDVIDGPMRGRRRLAELAAPGLRPDDYGWSVNVLIKPAS